jgi:carboxymethylenebutenolidase
MATLSLLAIACGGPKTAAFANPAPPTKTTLSNETVAFPNGNLTLHGSFYRPAGPGPFPAVVYNHGAAEGMMSVTAAEALGPVFVKRGWAFLMPYRRGQGLSSDAGPYILDQVNAVEKTDGPRAGAATAVRLLENEHLSDQLAGLAWLKRRADILPNRIAVAGTSFGGIETVLGAEHGSYCAAVDWSGGAMSWAESPEIQESMKRAVSNARVPIFFLQAQNDFDLSPSRVLSETMKNAGKTALVTIYPPYGSTPQEGHTLGYFGGSIWSDDVFRFLETSCPANAG